MRLQAENSLHQRDCSEINLEEIKASVFNSSVVATSHAI